MYINYLTVESVWAEVMIEITFNVPIACECCVLYCMLSSCFPLIPTACCFQQSHFQIKQGIFMFGRLFNTLCTKKFN